MKKLHFLIGIMLIAFSLTAQKPEKYSRVKIYYNTPENFQKLIQNGVSLEHGKHKKGAFFESDFSESEINLINSLGITTEVVIDDVQSFYIQRNQQTKTSSTDKNSTCSANTNNNYTIPNNFNHGSMGGFLTYSEMIAEIDSMLLLYPNLITAKSPIDTFTTHQNRPIYWVKISDNPNTDEPEPEMLYDAVHHAREPASLHQLIFYMWYLLENYASNSEVQAIINNTELYFIPVVNPDGYIYNETTNPNGGGMHRKNMRNNGGGVYGVDNNRNYDFIDENSNSVWGTTGISFQPDQDTYCGTGPFSEPENNAVKWFCEQHNFKLALNNHSYSDLLLFPYGYEVNKPTPEHSTFEAISELLVSQNTMVNEIASSLYAASGDSDDWMYGDTLTHNKIYAFTPEIGTSTQGFWPIEADIDDICLSTLFMNLTAAHLITNYARTQDLMPLVVSNTSGYLNYNIQRLGMENGNFTVTIYPVSANLISVGAAKNYNGMSFLQSVNDSISYALDPSINQGDIFTYVISVNNGLFTINDTITKIYGTSQNIFTDNGNNITNWTVSQTWGTTNTQYYSPSTSITDSPSGNYTNNTNKTITLTNPVNLTNAVSATLSFYAKWSVEAGYDYVQILVSNDNGTSWTPQCGKYTRLGTSDQDYNKPLYDGIQSSWVLEEIDLSQYIGQNIKFRFRIVSDYWANEDGFYFDDFTVSVINGNTSINQVNPLSSVSMYPNPCDDIVFIKNTNSKISFVEIVNQLGQSVITQQIDNVEAANINTSKLPNGVYFVKSSDGNNIYNIEKLVIMH